MGTVPEPPRIEEQKTATTDDALRCPLCDYDLRGLPSPRCPECGHAFDPDELRRAHAARRDWFFEDARGAIASPLLRTGVASLRPRRFWHQVTPTQPIRAGRLLLWATLWLAIVGSAMVLLLAISPGFSTVHARFDRWNRPPLAGLLFAVALAWPPVTIAVFQAFGDTLHRGNIRRGHLWRCVLYALPLMLLGTLLFAPLAEWTGEFGPQEWRWSPYSWLVLERLPKAVRQVLVVTGLSPLGALVLLWMIVVSTAHLVAAHRFYLRLPHAVGQALLVQAAGWTLILTMVGLLGI